MSRMAERIEQPLALIRMLQDSGLNTYGSEITSGCGPTMIVEGRECINFISNSYMGFSMHPRVVEAARQALLDYGVGIGGSPIACGTSRLHNQLAEKIAHHYGKEKALVFSTGYQALAGTIQGLMGRDDIAILDSLDHRSIVDGCALAGCKVRSFIHNNTEDLEQLLARLAEQPVERMVIVDSVYSMDGDIAPLPKLHELCQRFGATLLLDEAHSLGVMGKTGKGILEHFGMPPDGAELISGTFSKFAGAVGGFTAASRDVVDFLRHHASPFVFSASIPPALVAAVSVSFDLLTEEPQWLDRLWKNVRLLLDGLKSLGFDTGVSSTPVIPVLLRDTPLVLKFNRLLLDRGVYASPVIHPGVPLKKERIRIGVMATHTPAHIARALEVFRDVGRELGVLSSSA